MRLRFLRVGAAGGAAAPAVCDAARVFDSVGLLKERLRLSDPTLPPGPFDLYHGGRCLIDTERLAEVGVSDGALLLIAIADAAADAADAASSLVAYHGTPWPAPLLLALSQARAGLELGLAPHLSVEGEGGTYFMPMQRESDGDERRPPAESDVAFVACFKPRDEETFAPRNPKRFVGAFGTPTLRVGVLSGEAYARECAAFLLDHGGFAGVPPTALVRCSHAGFNNDGAHLHSKLGSFQLFVDGATPVEDFGPTRLPVEEVQKIALFDLRLMNLDRNGDNLLVKWVMREETQLATSTPPAINSASSSGGGGGGVGSGGGAWRRAAAGRRKVLVPSLVPIDHGFILPSDLGLAWCDWCWMGWPQVRAPLSPAFVAYVAALDAERDIALLKAALGPAIRPACYTTLRVTTLVLQRGVAAGMNLADIASCLARVGDDLSESSLLERMVETAGITATSAVHNVREPLLLSLAPPLRATAGVAAAAAGKAPERRRRLLPAPLYDDTGPPRGTSGGSGATPGGGADSLRTPLQQAAETVGSRSSRAVVATTPTPAPVPASVAVLASPPTTTTTATTELSADEASSLQPAALGRIEEGALAPAPAAAIRVAVGGEKGQLQAPSPLVAVAAVVAADSRHSASTELLVSSATATTAIAASAAASPALRRRSVVLPVVAPSASSLGMAEGAAGASSLPLLPPP